MTRLDLSRIADRDGTAIDREGIGGQWVCLDVTPPRCRLCSVDDPRPAGPVLLFSVPGRRICARRRPCKFICGYSCVPPSSRLWCPLATCRCGCGSGSSTST